MKKVKDIVHNQFVNKGSSWWKSNSCNASTNTSAYNGTSITRYRPKEFKVGDRVEYWSKEKRQYIIATVQKIRSVNRWTKNSFEYYCESDDPTDAAWKSVVFEPKVALLNKSSQPCDAVSGVTNYSPIIRESQPSPEYQYKSGFGWLENFLNIFKNT